MRLQRLTIERFRGLRDVTMAFPDPTADYGSTDLRFFVGRNGTGKSTALEALALIFSHLAADAHPGFAFELEYELRGSRVRLTTQRADANASPHAIAAYEGVDGAWRLVEPGPSRDRLLPDRVIGYSTGPTSGMGDALYQAIERQMEEIRVEQDEADEDAGLADDVAHRRRESFFDNPHTLFLSGEECTMPILAALLAADGPALPKTALKQLGLDAEQPLLAFSTRLLPDWETALPVHHRLNALRLLEAAATYTVFDDEEEPNRSCRIAGFDVTRELRAALRERVGPPLAIMELLLSWHRRGILQDLRLVLRKRGMPEPITDQDLSDGELFYLSRYGLLSLVAETEESLLLLDEPETHFNDNWKIDLVEDVTRALGGSSRASAHQVVIATHSDLTLTDADPALLQLFIEHSDGIAVHPAPVGTFGAAPGDLGQLLFGLPAPVGQFSERVMRDALEAGDREELERLARIMGPGYLRLAVQLRVAESEGER